MGNSCYLRYSSLLDNTPQENKTGWSYSDVRTTQIAFLQRNCCSLFHLVIRMFFFIFQFYPQTRQHWYSPLIVYLWCDLNLYFSSSATREAINFLSQMTIMPPCSMLYQVLTKPGIPHFSTVTGKGISLKRSLKSRDQKAKTSIRIFVN